MGHFSFGGVAVCVFFKHGRVVLDPDLLLRTEQGIETIVKGGAQIAMARDRTSTAWMKATDTPLSPELHGSATW